MTPALTKENAGQSALAKCLPTGMKLGDVVETTNAVSVSGQPDGPHKVTVGEKLNDLKATCNGDNKLVDGKGKPIVFYHLIGCWGNPPPNYQEILQEQLRKIKELKAQNTVIEMTCNPSGARIQ